MLTAYHCTISGTNTQKSLWKRSAGDTVTAEFYDSTELRWESEVATGSQIQKRILKTNSVLAEEHFMAAETYHKQFVVEVTPSG
jgi:hypothetical protein